MQRLEKIENVVTAISDKLGCLPLLATASQLNVIEARLERLEAILVGDDSMSGRNYSCSRRRTLNSQSSWENVGRARAMQTPHVSGRESMGSRGSSFDGSARHSGNGTRPSRAASLREFRAPRSSRSSPSLLRRQQVPSLHNLLTPSEPIESPVELESGAESSPVELESGPEAESDEGEQGGEGADVDGDKREEDGTADLEPVAPAPSTADTDASSASVEGPAAAADAPADASAAPVVEVAASACSAAATAADMESSDAAAAAPPEVPATLPVTACASGKSDKSSGHLGDVSGSVSMFRREISDDPIPAQDVATALMQWNAQEGHGMSVRGISTSADCNRPASEYRQFPKTAPSSHRGSPSPRGLNPRPVTSGRSEASRTRDRANSHPDSPRAERPRSRRASNDASIVSAHGLNRATDSGGATTRWTVDGISRMAVNDEELAGEIAGIRMAQTKAIGKTKIELEQMSLKRAGMGSSWGMLRRELPLQPGSRARRAIDAIAFVNALFSAAWFPLEGYFSPQACDRWTYAIAVPLAQIATVCGILDVALFFVTAYREDGNLVTDQAKITRRYLRGWFAIDLLANLPVWSITALVNHSDAAESRCYGSWGAHASGWYRFAGVNHLLRLMRLQRVLEGLSNSFVARITAKIGINPSLLRLLKLLAWMCVSFHSVACYWWHVRRVEYDWAKVNNDEGEPASTFGANEPLIQRVLPEVEEFWVSHQYCLSLWWSVTTTMGFEAPLMVDGPLEQLYVAAVIMLGVMVTSFVIGSATSIVTNMDAISSKRKQELSLLEQYMHSQHVPHALRQRVIGFYEFVTNQIKSLDPPEVIRMLPKPMQLHLSIVTNRRLFTDVTLFKSCEPEVVAVCLRVMVQQICVPNERVLVKGEEPRALFIIKSGHVQVEKNGGAKPGGGADDAKGSGRNSSVSDAKASATEPTRRILPHMPGLRWTASTEVMKRDEGSSCGGEKTDETGADFSTLYKQGGATTVINFYANDIFGERSLITRKPVTATVTSVTYSDLLVLGADDFYRLLEQFPQLHEAILLTTGLQDRLRCPDQSYRGSRARNSSTATRPRFSFSGNGPSFGQCSGGGSRWRRVSRGGDALPRVSFNMRYSNNARGHSADEISEGGGSPRQVSVRSSRRSPRSKLLSVVGDVTQRQAASHRSLAVGPLSPGMGPSDASHLIGLSQQVSSGSIGPAHEAGHSSTVEGPCSCSRKSECGATVSPNASTAASRPPLKHKPTSAPASPESSSDAQELGQGVRPPAETATRTTFSTLLQLSSCSREKFRNRTIAGARGTSSTSDDSLNGSFRPSDVAPASEPSAVDRATASSSSARSSLKSVRSNSMAETPMSMLRLPPEKGPFAGCSRSEDNLRRSSLVSEPRYSGHSETRSSNCSRSSLAGSEAGASAPRLSETSETARSENSAEARAREICRLSHITEGGSQCGSCRSDGVGSSKDPNSLRRTTCECCETSSVTTRIRRASSAAHLAETSVKSTVEPVPEGEEEQKVEEAPRAPRESGAFDERDSRVAEGSLVSIHL